MEQAVGADAENKLITILKILSESSEPLGSITIARRLEDEGIFLSERAIQQRAFQCVNCGCVVCNWFESSIFFDSDNDSDSDPDGNPGGSTS